MTITLEKGTWKLIRISGTLQAWGCHIFQRLVPVPQKGIYGCKIPYCVLLAYWLEKRNCIIDSPNGNAFIFYFRTNRDDLNGD